MSIILDKCRKINIGGICRNLLMSDKIRVDWNLISGSLQKPNLYFKTQGSWLWSTLLVSPRTQVLLLLEAIVSTGAGLFAFFVVDVELEPNPPIAQPTSTPHLILHSHANPNTGVLMSTFSTGYMSGYCVGGFTSTSSRWTMTAAVYVVCYGIQINQPRRAFN